MDIGHPKYDPALKEQPPLELPHWFSSKKEKKVSAPQSASTPPPVTTPPASTPLASTPPKEQPTPPAKQEYFWPAYVAGIIAIAVIVFFGVRAASSLFDVWTDLEPTAKLADSTGGGDSADTAATDTTTAAATTETATADTPAETAAAPEETPAATPAPAATIDPASLTVRVLNGNGVPGAAQKAADVLAAANIPVASTANAKKFSYSATMVYYPTGKKDAATLVANALSTSYSTQLEENAVADGYDALVVVGAQ